MNRQHSILIIDDTDGLPQVVSNMLAKKGYKVVCVNTVAQARARLRDNDPPTIILADRMLESGAVEDRELLGLCREALAISAEVLVYTEKLKLSDEEHQKILNRGAYRVLDKDDVEEIKNDVDILIHDFDEIADLIAELNADTSDERSKFMTALIGSDVSLSVLDHRYVHRYSKTAPELLSKSEPEATSETALAKVGVCQSQCWLAEHDQIRKQHHCWGCTVAAVFDSQRTVEGLFLNRQQNGSIGWVDVQSKPIKSRRNHTIAVREAVGEASDIVLSNLTLDRRLRLIAESLIRAGFGRARIYTFDVDGTVANLRAAAAWSDRTLVQTSDYFESVRYLSLDLASEDSCPYARAAHESRVGSFIDKWTDEAAISPLKAKLKLEPPYFDIPVYRANGLLHSWLSVDFIDMPEPLRSRAIKQYGNIATAIWLQEEFGREIRLADLTEGKPGYREKFEVARRARFGIANAKSVDGAIDEIMNAFRELLPSCRISVRIKRGDTLQEFEKLCWGEAVEPSQPNFSLENGNSLSVAVVKHPLPKWIDDYPAYVVNTKTTGEPVGYPPKGTMSTAQIPLKLENIVFGTLSIGSPEMIQWGEEGFKEPLIMLARDIALVLRDLALQEDIDKAMDERTAMTAYSVSVSADGLWRHWAQQRLSEVSAGIGLLRTELDHEAQCRKELLLKELIAIGDVITRIQTAQVTKDAPPTCSINTVLMRLREIYSGKTPTPTFPTCEDYTVAVPEFILRDILTILVDNALFSIQTSGVGSAITITAQALGDDLCVVVCDDGPGIPVEVQHRIFRGFVQSSKGRGLGLLYARGAALNYHGDLTFVSHAGATKFTLRIPLHNPTEGRN